MSRVQIPSLAPILPASFFWNDFTSAHKQRSLDEPVAADGGHHERARGNESRHEHGALSQFPDEWEQNGGDDELPHLDAEVERDKGGGAGPAGRVGDAGGGGRGEGTP